MTKVGPLEQLTSGFTREIVRDYVEALLPPLWTRVHGPEVVPDFHADSGLVITLAASHRNGPQCGVRHPVPAFVEPLAVASELGLLLANACKEAESKYAGRLGPRAMRFALVRPGAQRPTRGTSGSSGYDLYAPERVRIQSMRIVVVHTGVVLELPDGFEAQVRPRSSMAKRGLWASLGTVDEDYRGEIGATIVNLNNEDATIEKGDRIGQVVLSRVEHVRWVETPEGELSKTERGIGGFGSTGA